jgi:hypothetical protein
MAAFQTLLGLGAQLAPTTTSCMLWSQRINKQKVD